MAVTIFAGRAEVTVRTSKTQNRNCKRSYRPRYTDDYKGALHIVWPGNKKLLAGVGFFFMSLCKDVQGKGQAMTLCLLSQTVELILALHSPVMLPDNSVVQSTAPRTLRRRRCRNCILVYGTRSDAWGGIAERSWAAESFSRDQSTRICSTSFSASCQHLQCHFFCIWSLGFSHLWKLLVQLPWATAADRDSAHLSLLHSRFLCLLTAWFPIQSSRYFLICFIAEQVPTCKRRGLWRQTATAGRVFQPRQTFTSTSIMAFPTLGPQLQWQLTPHTS